MRTTFVLFSLLAIGLVQASPFVDPYNAFDDGAALELQPEFVPLEHQRPRQTHHTTQAVSKPFEVDVITTDVNGGNGGTSVSHLPGSVFRNRFPFFGNDFLNAFGVSGFERAPEWWRGPNVCVERTEKPLNNTNDVEEFIVPELGNFHFTSNSCIERPNKYVCTQVVFENGKKKTLTVTRQCCPGYGRSRNAGYSEPCEKREIMTVDNAAVALGAKEFATLAKSNNNANLLSSQKNVTFFLPMDMPLASYRDEMQNENNFVSGTDEAEVNNLIMRHIAMGELNLDEAANEQVLKTLDPEQTIRINAFPMARALSGEPFRYTANCVPIERPEKYTEQGLAYALNGVMKPVNKTLMDLIRERPDMSIITTVLESTKLSKMLEGEKPISIFAPTDKAFEQLDPSLSRALREGKNCAANIIKNHIVDLSFCSVAAIPEATTTVINLLGEPLRFKHAKSEPIQVNGLANITETDIMGTNGVLHVLDAFLPTNSAMPLSTLMKQKNLTIFERLVDAAGMTTVFDDLQNATVFAPTDKALNQTKWSEMLYKTPEQLKDNAELKELINYHVVKPMIKTSDFVEKEYPTEAGSNVRVNLYSTHALFTNVMNRATVNCARVVHFDDESCGSVLHQVDKVLTPAKMTLLQQLESNPEYSHFLSLLRAANLTDRLNEPSKEGYTLLVPKNDVFAELGDWEQRIMQNREELENLVKTHIVNEVVCCAGIIPTQWPFVRYVEAMNGAHLRISRNQRPKIENAGITKCDNIASNGIIHEINDMVVVQQRRRNPALDDMFFK